ITKLVHLRYASAADVASALSGFLTNSLTELKSARQDRAFVEMERGVTTFAEPISNRLLISAAPSYMPEIDRLLNELDVQPTQVVIQVLIAEVDLSATEEFGVEVGLQSPVLFTRS